MHVSTPETAPEQHPRTFASDNYSGVHPEVLAAVAEANTGHAAAYGDDPWTAQLNELIAQTFAPAAEAYPVFNGTGANVVGLQAALPRWGAVICAASAHINSDEGGAPEKTAGIKLLPVEAPEGKLTPELVEQQAWGWGDQHRAQPLAVSISQSTELGTCYTPGEIRALADHAHERGMILHLDGSRLGNAAAHLGTSLASITSDAGVDVLSLGGTKNGLLGAEAVVVLNPEAVSGIDYLRKSNMQLGSKMRFLSAQLIALYGGDLWQRSAGQANAMAQRLRTGLEQAPGVGLPVPTQANVVFATLPSEAKERARKAFHFYDWPGDPHLVRLMCSFDTTADDVDALLAAIRGDA